jgi:BRCT domain type II-containing protein
VTSSEPCTGWIESLRGESVLFTGKTHVDGEHVERRHLRQRTLTVGGHLAPDQSAYVTVLVCGEMWSGPLTDPHRRYSRKLVYFEDLMRKTGQHIHVIDGNGFGNLMKGRPARCHDLLAPR